MITHRPGDPGYQKARKLFIGRHYEMLPQAILECATEDDVVMALDMARGGPFAIRGGGHSLAEHSTSNGLVLDLAGPPRSTSGRAPCWWAPGSGSAS